MVLPAMFRCGLVGQRGKAYQCCRAVDQSEDETENPEHGMEDGAGDASEEEIGSLQGLGLREQMLGDQPPVRAMLLPMLCVFQGYACMVGPAQQKFKGELGIGQSGETALVFTQAAVFVHYGKLVARLGHDVIFGALSPLNRVYLSMTLMLIGTLIPPFFVFDLHSHWIGTVFLSYGLSGIGLGIFECTFLNIITPLGKLTKAWAIMGIPLGFGIVNILGLLCTSAGMPVSWLYWYIVLLVPVGMLVVYFMGPGNQAKGAERAQPPAEQAGLAMALRAWRVWLPVMLPYIIAKVVVNFVMENVTPVNYYTYNAAEVPLLGPRAAASGLLHHDLYFALLGLFVLLGDTVSRRVPASLELQSPRACAGLLLAAALCSLVGFYLESLAVAALAWAGIFCAFWGNGVVYGASAKFIDHAVPREYNLIAYSLWCFMGDLGAIAGGTTVDLVRNWVCAGHEFRYECLSHN